MSTPKFWPKWDIQAVWILNSDDRFNTIDCKMFCSQWSIRPNKDDHAFNSNGKRGELILPRAVAHLTSGNLYSRSMVMRAIAFSREVKRWRQIFIHLGACSLIKALTHEVVHGQKKSLLYLAQSQGLNLTTVNLCMRMRAWIYHTASYADWSNIAIEMALITRFSNQPSNSELWSLYTIAGLHYKILTSAHGRSCFGRNLDASFACKATAADNLQTNLLTRWPHFSCFCFSWSSSLKKATVESRYIHAFIPLHLVPIDLYSFCCY